MRNKIKKIFSGMISFLLLVCTILIYPQSGISYTSEIDNTIFIKKISKSYTNRFCNAIGFGLSKESAMKFSLEENKQVFKKRKEFNNIDKELLAEEIAISVIEKCGYPIYLTGEKGILEFKSYYLSQDKEYQKKEN